VQPSELAKVALVLALARYFQRYPPSQTTRLRELCGPGDHRAAGRLILGQHDMGVALLTLLIGGTYVFLVRIPSRVARGRRRAGVAALAALWTFALAPYQKERILTVVDPEPRSARVGLPVRAVADRDRLGRSVRDRLSRGHPDAAALPARAAHRLRVLGARRGVGLRRQLRDARALRDAAHVGARRGAQLEGRIRRAARDRRGRELCSGQRCSTWRWWSGSRP
jgi:hypothetical protein